MTCRLLRERPRVFVATDISNEPDDQISLVRLLTYANELDLRGLAVVTSVWKNDSLDTASVHTVLDAYANVTALLDANAPASAPYPSADATAAFVRKLRVYAISDQDDAGAWLRANYPGLFYVVALHGFSEYTQASWNNGISGEAGSSGTSGSGRWGSTIPTSPSSWRATPPFCFPLLNNGLGDPEHPEWGSWGGRFLRIYASGRYPLYSDASDVAVGISGEIYLSAFAGIWRWRQAYQHDLAARMQWTTAGDAAQNNHAPVAVVNGACGPDPVKLSCQLGETVVLDAASGSWDSRWRRAGVRLVPTTAR
ncbi:uncharacterized protein PG986_002453 [Apiospora aurea]|uniref:Cellulose-binding Sde182 nucleoside hydrolase-like domain-containing protein n=1 Tax=Apiospora aurea TaxID=335848 RepID=A0ABR1QNW0_9PEZI